jgi:hypothetical protein
MDYFLRDVYLQTTVHTSFFFLTNGGLIVMFSLSVPVGFGWQFD